MGRDLPPGHALPERSFRPIFPLSTLAMPSGRQLSLSPMDPFATGIRMVNAGGLNTVICGILILPAVARRFRAGATTLGVCRAALHGERQSGRQG